MARTAATKLQDEIELVRREAFAAGYAAAMKLIREYASRSKSDSATRPGSQRQQASAPQRAPAGRRQGRSAARSPKGDAPAKRSPRGTNARLIIEVLEEIAPRAACPSEIREMLRDKGSPMAAASIHFALSQLQARGEVEQVADTKAWRYLGKTE
jgi:hypothetical protein